MTKSDTEKASADSYTVRDYRRSNSQRREYRADGTLYAFRDGDTHVVISNGKDPQTQWTQQFPAERSAVVAGEHLWTIPDNWDHRVKIDGVGNRRYAIYHIPQTDVDVLVTVPSNCHLVDTWYSVKRVGTLSVTYADDISWDELERALEHLTDNHATDPESEGDTNVVEALERLSQLRHGFEREFAKGVNMCAEDNLFERAYQPVSVDEWTTEPWTDSYPTDRLLEEYLDIDSETRSGVQQTLSGVSLIPNYPTVRVDVTDDESLPGGYEIRALVEAGASGAETIDYLVTEHHDLLTQAEWADRRGKTQSAISRNVSGAESELSD